MIVDILTPAVNRPKILETTLSSLTSKLKGVDFSKSTIYLHVDPVPSLINYNVIEEVAKKYFNNVVIKYSTKPHYPTAWLWTINQCVKMSCKFCILLCDDWEFIKEFHIDEVIKRFNIDTGVNSIAINNDWEHGTTFGNSKGRHKVLERGNFRGTPSFYKVSFLKENLSKLQAVPGEVLNLGTFAFNKQTSFSLWLSDEWKYYVKDIGCNWRVENKIPGSMLARCSRYKTCIYCGEIKWRYNCKDLSGNKCDNGDVICSETCWESHCKLFHKNDKSQYILYNCFPKDIDFNNYHNSWK